MAKLRQFLLLIWKNYKLQVHHPWVTLFELGIPALLSVLLVVVRINVSSEYISHPTFYEPFSVSEVDDPSFINWQLLYVPNYLVIEDIVNRTNRRLGALSNAKGFSSEKQMLQYYSNSATETKVFAGIVFDDVVNTSIGLPNCINYKIRMKALSGLPRMNSLGDWQTKYEFPVIQGLGPREKNDDWGGSPGYMKRHFLPLQHAVDMSITEYLTSNEFIDDMFELEMQRYPYPPYDADLFLQSLQFFFPFVIMLSFVYPCLNIVKNLVAEKEKKLKLSMKMMGLSNWMHWTAWYIKCILFLCVSVVFITLLLTVKFRDGTAVITKSDPLVVFLILMIYASSTICFCFFLSVLFSKANSAAAASGIVFFLSLVPYLFMFPRYADLSISEKMASCLLLNTALGVATIVLTTWESTGVGLDFQHLSQSPTPNEDLTMNTVLLMMVIDAVVYLLLTWYIEAVFPGEYGVPEPFYFPFMRSYWCGSHQNSQDMTRLYDSGEKNWEFFEKEPVDLMPGIQIQGLSKVYDKKKLPAVNNLYANMFRGQISVLLGHNGAGKTTTISMLTGLFPPSSGIAIVNGYDICDDIEGVHSSLGVCPQHNVLFDDLTVEEHLYFFCKLKGYITDLVPLEVNRMISALGLEDKTKTQAKALSGGMKRKLSVGIALVGGSQVVILDEPTSGMDPSARRFIWDLLQTEKEDRTILLTTHFMEEADILGDRIAIMAEGEIRCYGSPLFLKKKYGIGYHLVIVKEHSCDISAITDLVQFHVPTAKLSRNVGSELAYILPHESSHLFQSLFSEMEEKKEELRISSFGASFTTMEEVFIKVGEMASVNELLEMCKKETRSSTISITDSGAYDLGDRPSSPDSDLTVNLQVLEPEVQRNSGAVLFCQQMKALILKRILYSARNRLLTLSQIILPPFFLILTLIVLKTMPKPEDSPPMKLNLAHFHDIVTPYSITNQTVVQKMYESFRKQFPDPSVLKEVKGGNMTSYLVEEGSENIEKYLHSIIAASIRYDEVEQRFRLKSWFNNQAFHSPAISLSYIDNMLLDYFVNTSYSLSVTNYPLPRTASEQAEQQQYQPTEAYEISQNMMFGMSFLIASFAVFLVKEKSTRAKHLQRVSGVNLFSFWLATFVWDFACYMISCILMLLVFYCFSTAGFSTPGQQGHLLLLFIIHGCSALPFVYCCSFLFQLPSTSYVSLCLCNILGGIGTVLVVTIMEIPALDLQNTSKILNWIFTVILPNYCLGRSVSNLYQNYQFNNICGALQITCDWPQPPFIACCPNKCGGECIHWVANYLSWTNPGIGKQLVFLSIQAVSFFIILCALELKLVRYIKYHVKEAVSIATRNSSDLVLTEDDDVLAEHNRILNTPLSVLHQNNRLVLKLLTKYYGSLLSVDKLSFGVQKGECFGLLGLNGAGKTTTFKMITGEYSMSSGDVYLDGYSVRSSLRKVQQRLGYCPQFDALIDQLTGRESLIMYARLRGLPEEIISSQIKLLSSLLCFDMHMDKQVKDYSGGNKRKLSVAIALIGQPSIVFLDEPTTGMDPVSKRHMWNVLLRVLQSGCSIVLTSHSMEECEALCNKLVIMVNGRLCCLGTPQHLKSKFGQGYTLIVKVGAVLPENSCIQNSALNVSNEVHFLPPTPHLICKHACANEEAALKENVKNVKCFVEQTFPGSVLKDAHRDYLHYHIPKSGMRWSQIFGEIEKAKTTLNIKDYSVGQTTLEEIFLNFARFQREQNN